MPTLVLHALPPSHACMTAEAALRLKGLDVFAKRWFADCPGFIPAGAFPRSWVPVDARSTWG